MPRKALKPCKHPGCPNLTAELYCEIHKQPDRPSSAKRGYNSKWRKLSKQYLRKHPMCVRCMAEGVRRLTGSDFAVATSGIAGPTGGSEEKPVGLVWIGIASPRGSFTRSFVYKNDRKRNMERFAATALNLLRLEILENSKKQCK